MLRHFVDARPPGAGGRELRPGRTVWPRMCARASRAGFATNGRFVSRSPSGLSQPAPQL